MQPDPTQWRFINESVGGQKSTVESISFAIERLNEVAGKEMGETICFQHSEKGLILCTAGRGFSSLTFDPDYDEAAHSTRGFRNALRTPPVVDEDLLFVDDTSTISSLPTEYVLPLVEAVRGIVYILESHEYPSFLEWSPER